MIRRAVQTDMPQLVQMVQEYYRQQEYQDRSNIPSLPSDVSVLARKAIQDHIVVVNEQEGVLTGVVAGAVVPWLVNHQETAAQEFIAYGEGVAELRSVFDRVAKHRGAKASLLSCFLPHPGNRMRKL